MSIWCAVPIVIALAIGYFVIYAMCKVAGDADGRSEAYLEYLKGEEEHAKTR